MKQYFIFRIFRNGKYTAYPIQSTTARFARIKLLRMLYKRPKTRHFPHTYDFLLRMSCERVFSALPTQMLFLKHNTIEYLNPTMKSTFINPPSSELKQSA